MTLKGSSNLSNQRRPNYSPIVTRKILDVLETIRQRMRNCYIQGRSQTNQATKSTEVVQGSPIELKEFSLTVEITHANEVTLLELIPLPQQT